MSQPDTPGSHSRDKSDLTPLILPPELVQAVLDGMQDGVTVVDRNGRFTLRNAAAERIAGISPQHVSAIDWSRALGVCLADGVTPMPEDQVPVARALRGETVDWLDLFVKHPHAPEGKWISIAARPFADALGIPTGAICTYRDITGRKQSERALRASEARYRILFEENLAGILRTTFDGTVLECNEAFAGMLGYGSRAEACSLKSHQFYNRPSDRDEMLARLREQKALTQQEICFRRKDGSPVWILANLNLVESADPDGAPTIVGTTVDISERKRSRKHCVRASSGSQPSCGIFPAWPL